MWYLHIIVGHFEVVDHMIHLLVSSVFVGDIVCLCLVVFQIELVPIFLVFNFCRLVRIG